MHPFDCNFRHELCLLWIGAGYIPGFVSHSQREISISGGEEEF